MMFRRCLTAILFLLACSLTVLGQVTSSTYAEQINPAPSDLALTSDAPIYTLGQAPVLTARLDYPKAGQPSGNVTFTVTDGEKKVATSIVAVDLKGVTTWNPSLPTGTYTVFAVYGSDNNIQRSLSAAISITVLGPADFTFSADPITVGRGQAGTSSLAVKVTNGFSGKITFSCKSPEATVACDATSLTIPYTPVSDSKVYPAGSAVASVTTMATVVKRASISTLLLFMMVPFFARKRRLAMALYFCLGLMMLTVGCGGGGLRYVQEDGTPRGTYLIPVTGTSGSISHTQTLVLTVR